MSHVIISSWRDYSPVFGHVYNLVRHLRSRFMFLAAIIPRSVDLGFLILRHLRSRKTPYSWKNYSNYFNFFPIKPTDVRADTGVYLAGRHGGLPLHVGGIIPQEGWFYGGDALLYGCYGSALQGINAPLYRAQTHRFANHPFTLRASDAKKTSKNVRTCQKILYFCAMTFSKNY